jgi:signal transduction histidine kinase
LLERGAQRKGGRHADGAGRRLSGEYSIRLFCYPQGNAPPFALTVTLPSSRLVAIVAGCSLGLAALGWAWEASRFGLSSDAEAARLHADVRRRFDGAVRRVDSLARRVASDATVIQFFSAPEQSDALFSRLIDLARANGALEVSATVHAPAGPAGAYRVIAWSDGPAGDLTADQLAGPATLFVTVGAAGLRLVSAQPIEASGRRLGVATAEAILAAPHAAADQEFTFDTSFGAVWIARPGAHRTSPAASSFILSSPSGQPLLEARFDPAMLGAGRAEFRRRVVATSLVPLLVLILPAMALVQTRRNTCAVMPWLAWTAAQAAIIGITTLAVAGVAGLVGARSEVIRIVFGAGALSLAASAALGAWWRQWPRRTPRRAPARFAAEQLIAGLALAGLITLLTRVLGGNGDASGPIRQLSILSADAMALVELGGTLLLEIALGWTAAGLLALLALRWKLGWRRASGWVALALWMAPTLVLLTQPRMLPGAAAVAAAAAAGFGLLAGNLRHSYRHTSQSVRLLLLFGALLLPVIASYPLASHSHERAVRGLIEREYGPETAAAQRADRLYSWLQTAQREIDSLANLAQELPAVPAGGRVESQAAFRVWSQTTLSRNRVSSEIELFGANGNLASRFALNVPEFETALRPGVETWSGSGCTWDAFAEVNRFGTEERRRLHAERGLCDASGRIAGAVVIHVLPDYRVLPFVSSANPYLDVIARPAAAASRVPDLQVVVYGWNLQPAFSSSSGRITWPIPADVDGRLYRSRDPFWTELAADGRRFHVYFLSDRAGIYAVGYPTRTLFQHLSRLSELFAVTAGVFILLIAVLTAYAPFSAALRHRGPLRAVLEEIRTSFYRKLFLFFGLAAIGPALLFAAAFTAYTMARFRADIESEAAGTVTVARRVFEELFAADRHPGQAPPDVSDDVMVWIHQVIDQDVNLYAGPSLIATSQRDLFDSGLLPTRTPASVYREIALHRAPTFVALDRIGSFQYLVAAAPVPARGKDAVLSVPLASRQRDLEREIEDVNRGVLIGVVVVILFAAGLGASVAGRVSDPVSRLTRATRLIAAGRLDVRLVADTADELGRLVEDFNAMAETLIAQRAELARTHQLKAWADMARQVAHEIKNPLTPIQLAAEHLRHVHEDARRPLGPVFDQCVDAVLKQVRLLRQIAAEFSSFGTQAVARPASVAVDDLVEGVVGPYRPGLADRIRIETAVTPGLSAVWVDRTLVSRALANLVENAVQAMPGKGVLTVSATATDAGVAITVRDTGAGMDAEAVRRAFEPYFSTKTAGSGLGLANAKRNIEACGGSIDLRSDAGTGTTVTVVLPVRPPDASASAPPPSR